MNSSSSSVICQIREATIQGSMNDVLEAVYFYLYLFPPPSDSYFLAFVRCIFAKDASHFRPALYYAVKAGHAHLVEFYLKLLIIARMNEKSGREPRTVLGHLQNAAGFPCWFTQEDFFACRKEANKRELWQFMEFQLLRLKDLISDCLNHVGFRTLVGQSLEIFARTARRPKIDSTRRSPQNQILTGIPIRLNDSQPCYMSKRQGKKLTASSLWRRRVGSGFHTSNTNNRWKGNVPRKYHDEELDVTYWNDWIKRYETKEDDCYSIEAVADGLRKLSIDESGRCESDVSSSQLFDCNGGSLSNIPSDITISSPMVNDDVAAAADGYKSTAIISRASSFDADGWELLSEDENDVISLASFHDDKAPFSYKEALTSNIINHNKTMVLHRQQVTKPTRRKRSQQERKRNHDHDDTHENGSFSAFDSDFIRDGIKGMRSDRQIFLKAKSKHQRRKRLEEQY